MTTPLRSTLDVTSDDYLENRRAQEAALGELQEQLDLACAGGGAKYADRHRSRGRFLAR